MSICCDCGICAYAGCCLAGNGDDDFALASKEKIIDNLKRNRDGQLEKKDFWHGCLYQKHMSHRKARMSELTNEELIKNEKYHTCGRCKYDNTPDDKYPCVSCTHGTDYRTDLWELEQLDDIKAYDSPTNGSIFLKTYPDSRLSNIAYDYGICYVYVDLGGSRVRFTSDWWNASYKTNEEEASE